MIINAACECPVGLGEACGHIGGLLYTVSNYKMLGMEAVPTDKACTSQPMTWHIPRGPKIGGAEVQHLSVHSYNKGTITSTTPKPIDSTLYNPLRSPPPPSATVYQSMQSAHPKLMALDFMHDEPTTPVHTKFGIFPKGSPLSYQQKLSGETVINLYDNSSFPVLPASDVMMNNYDVASLDDAKSLMLSSITIDAKQSTYFEESTRLQSQTKSWYEVRKNRITASNFGSIAKRKKSDVTKLVQRLQSTRHVQTQAMKDGLAREPQAVTKYCNLKDNNVNVYPCGCVVSVTAPWLAASPDRKVYDPQKEDPYGLLEVKCPESNTLAAVECLIYDNGQYSLKKNHNYFYQVLCQLAVTGLPWCDFIVWCHQEDTLHCETIRFADYKDMWNEAKDKVDAFYFESFI